MRTIFIDMGHGGIINGEYQTDGKQYAWGDDVFFEGVSNREIGEDFAHELKIRNIPHVIICPTELDIPLDARCDVINRLHQECPDAILISLHHNAGGGTGFEVWTSVGDTPADPLGDVLYKEFALGFPGVTMRSDKTDGDFDKESQFYILKNTNCPAILPECLFYDTWKDYQRLIDPVFRRDYVATLVRWAQKVQSL